MEMSPNLEFLLLWLSFLVLRFACVTHAYDLQIFRGYQGKIQDWFQSPQLTCQGTVSLNCADHGALKVSVSRSCYICRCPVDKSTFGYFDGRWQCIGNAELRQKTGCEILFYHDQPTSPLKIVQSAFRNLLKLPQDRICRYQYATDTSVLTCSGNWSNTISGSTRYHWKSYLSRRRYYHRLDVDANGMGAAAFQGRVVQLNITCVKKRAPAYKSCVLLKDRYITAPRTCTFTRASPTTSTTTSSSPFPSTENSATTEANVAVTGSSTEAEGVNSTNSLHTARYPTNGTTPPQGNQQRSPSKQIEPAVIIGAAAGGGGLVIVIIIIVCVVCCWRRRKSSIMYSATLEQQDNGPARIYADAHYFPPMSPGSKNMLSHTNPGYGRGKDLSITMTAPRSDSSCITSGIPLTSLTSTPTSRMATSLSSSDDFNGVGRTDRLNSDDSMFMDMDAQGEKNNRPLPVIYENLKNLSESAKSNQDRDSQPFYAVLEGPESDKVSITEAEENWGKGDNRHNNPSNGNEVIYMNSPVEQSNKPGSQRFKFPEQGSTKYPKKPNSTSDGSNSKECYKENRGYDADDNGSKSRQVAHETHHYAPLQTRGQSRAASSAAVSRDNAYQELGMRGVTGTDSSEYQPLTPRTDRISTKPVIKPKPSVKPKPKTTK